MDRRGMPTRWYLEDPLAVSWSELELTAVTKTTTYAWSPGLGKGQKAPVGSRRVTL
jgi:hypothetical protein